MRPKLKRSRYQPKREGREFAPMLYCYIMDVGCPIRRDSAPTLFSAKSNGPNVGNQRKVERWVEALRSKTAGRSMEAIIEYGRATA